MAANYHSVPRKISIIGNYLPRQCGIATFTTDLLTALKSEDAETDYWAMVMNDIPEGYDYPAEVRFEVNQRMVSDYRLAADYLNMSKVDVVCLQHEFGIFGGENGAYILELLSNLRIPVVTTLHTVLLEPSPGQMLVTKRLAQLSDRLVVMSYRAVDILENVYGINRDKIVMIHHGIPDVPFVDPNYYKDQFGVEGRKVILSFGLISPAKGLEYMIEALPKIVSEFPDTVYLVLGATHPNVKRESGETYRFLLQNKVRELGVGDYLIFHNRFAKLSELCEFLGSADVYVTPYLNKEQIVSGSLAYALGSGKAVVSTPYWYAQEMLAENRGKIVPFRDPDALAEQICFLLGQEGERHSMRKRAYTFCREMVWKEVARKYIKVFREAKEERERKPKPVFRTRSIEDIPHEIPQPKLDHLIRLTDDVGILQHAKFIVPDRYHGYCTDDNARALIVVLAAREVIAEGDTLMNLACTYLSFLDYAFNEETKRFRNFMGYDRRWKEDIGSEDSHSRAVWGLGEAIAAADSEDIRGPAQRLFEKALPSLLDFSSPRAWAFGVVGANAYLKRYSGDSSARRIRDKLALKIFDLYKSGADDKWPWLESVVTYANGKICQALIVAGTALQMEEMLKAGLRSLEWLVEIQTSPRGHFSPIGNKGWYPRGGEKAMFDQQPIEALGIIEACREAYNVNREKKWLLIAQRCMEWFLGRNDLNVPLYDHKSGGCCDGLHADGPNRNQGAESTLAFFLSLLNILKLGIDQVSEASFLKKEEIPLARIRSDA